VKQHLGNIYLLCMLLFVSSLQAADFTYAVKVDNTEPYVKEAVLLTFDVNQTNNTIVLLFDFDLQKSESYSFQRIDIEEIDAYHAAQIRYTYLVYPLKAGEVDINFTLTQKATSDESVAYSFSGDRDNVKTLETKNSNIEVPPLRLKVKALPDGTEIVGNFRVDYKVKTLKGKPYEPLPLQVTIQGEGYPPIFNTLLPQEGNFTQFTEAPEVKSRATIKGTKSTVTYPMAFSHNKDFTLPELDIQAFDPKTQKSYTLLVPEQHFHIEEVNSSLLIDKVDTPSVSDKDWSWIQTVFNYLLVFTAGLLTAFVYKKSKQRIKPKKHTPHSALIEKIKQSKDLKALLQVLLAYDVKRFRKTIVRVEKTLYGTEKTSLKTLKQESLQTIENMEKIQ